MKKSLKWAFTISLSLPPLRWLTLAITHFLRMVSRLASRARFSALVPHARDCVCHWSTEIKYPENITFGHRVIIGPRCTIGAAAPIFFGDHVRISKRVTVETAGLDFATEPPYKGLLRPIRIERGVWLGTGAIVLGGVTIGEFSVIGAGTVISGNVPPNSIVTGAGTRVRSQEERAASGIREQR
jgi:maltose O-acetyltransferase